MRFTSPLQKGGKKNLLATKGPEKCIIEGHADWIFFGGGGIIVFPPHPLLEEALLSWAASSTSFNDLLCGRCKLNEESPPLFSHSKSKMDFKRGEGEEELSRAGALATSAAPPPRSLARSPPDSPSPSFLPPPCQRY